MPESHRPNPLRARGESVAIFFEGAVPTNLTPVGMARATSGGEREHTHLPRRELQEGREEGLRVAKTTNSVVHIRSKYRLTCCHSPPLSNEIFISPCTVTDHTNLVQMGISQLAQRVALTLSRTGRRVRE